jgi:hypothetical protein
MAWRSWRDGRGDHPAPNEAEWIVEHTTSSGFEVWYCNLCCKEVASDNGHMNSDHHAKKAHWHLWEKKQSAAKATLAVQAPATNTSAVTANTWLPAEAPASTSGTAAASSASSVVVAAPAALAPATTQGGTIFIELPVAVAFALKDALERALAGRQQ